MPAYGRKDSYFETCERDESGHCLPSGQAEAASGEEQNNPKEAEQEQSKVPPKLEVVGKPIIVTFDGEKDPPAFLEQQCREAERKLPDRATKAVLKYTGNDYLGLNAAMRGCPPEFECVEGKHRQLMEGVEEALSLAPPFDEPVTTYRGIRLGEEARGMMLEMAKGLTENGGLFSMPSITSTSINPDVATSFGSSDGVVFQIKAKKGLYVEKGLTEIEGEYEIIQSSRTKYKVLGVGEPELKRRNGESEGKQTVIYLEEIDPE